MSGAVTAAGAIVGGIAGIGGVGILAGAAAGGLFGAAVGTQYNAAKDAEAAQKQAMAQAQANADKQATAAEQAFNATNQKRPNTSEILDAATQAGRGGVSGTMLTGPQGVDPNSMALGRNTLLGQ